MRQALPPPRILYTRVVAGFGILTTLMVLPAAFAGPAVTLITADSAGVPFAAFIEQATNADSSTRNALVRHYILTVQAHRRAVIEDSSVHFLYFGEAKRVSLASDLNGWNPKTDTLTRLPLTNLFYRSVSVHPASRFEYKLVVDSVWVLDPLNQQQAPGGFGPNSEIWMPAYSPPKEIEYRTHIPHGRIDSLVITSTLFQRSHPVFVYLPAEYKKNTRKRYPVIFVTDGGEYMTLAQMPNVLDNLIADRRIQPVIAVFVDPRTDIRNAATNMRMAEYTMSDTFVNFLISEVREHLLRAYRIDRRPDQTAVMGASLGGLTATYAAFTRPDVFGLCAAQSPSYWWNQAAIIARINSVKRQPVRFYIDTGTLRDAQEHASMMWRVLTQKGYDVFYREYPEGHNWTNWRARIDDILIHFFGVNHE